MLFSSKTTHSTWAYSNLSAENYLVNVYVAQCAYSELHTEGDKTSFLILSSNQEKVNNDISYEISLLRSMKICLLNRVVHSLEVSAIGDFTVYVIICRYNNRNSKFKIMSAKIGTIETYLS